MREPTDRPDVSDPLVARLRGHVDGLAGRIGPRHLGRPSAVAATLALVERELADAADLAVAPEAYDAGGIEAVNLVAEIPGRDRPGEIVLLGAHYDTVETTPGADDNASAVAMLLECARLLRDCSPRRTIRFVAFACEEPPHFNDGTMGSRHHARQARSRDERITAMICLEMVGYYATEPGSQHVPEDLPAPLRRIAPTRGDFLAAVTNLASARLGLGFRRGFKRAAPDFPLFSAALPESFHLIRLSDNSSFWDRRYPALMLTDTSFLRNPHYHLPSDEPDTLDYQRMACATIGVAGAIAHLAAAAVRPA